MKKNSNIILKLFAMLVLGLLVLSSCKTLPSPASNNDTMLIIPLGIEKKGTADWFGKYRIHITNKSTGEMVKTHIMPISSGYTLIKGLTPGEYKISRDEFIYNHNRSPGSHVNRSYPFTLSAGKITILNKKFVYTFLPKSSGRSTMNRKWQTFPSVSKWKLLESFEEYKNFELWNIE